jgi:hypothetical protein
MSDTITNRGDIYNDLQNILNMNSDDYCSLGNRIESRIGEYDLKGELTNYRESLINEVRDFEESLLFKNIQDEDTSEYYDSRPYSSDQIIFTINKRLKYITNIYLEIDLDTSFHGLTLEEKIDLFNMNIKIDILHNTILNSTILVCLISQLCEDKHINSIENKLLIPILSFEGGVQVYSINHNNMDVIIGTKNAYKFRKTMRLLCIGDFSDKIDVINRKTHTLILQTDLNDYQYIKNNKYINISANGLAKALFLYFIPKNINNLSTSPNINSLKFRFDKLEGMEYTSDDLNSIDILGIRIYIVSFSKEFDTMEGIKKCLKDPSKNISCSGINLSLYYNKLLWLESDDNLEDYTMYITPIKLNIINMVNMIYTCV